MRSVSPATDAWQDLQRDTTFQVGVGCPIHLAHAALPDQRGDFVGTDAAPGRQHPRRIIGMARRSRRPLTGSPSRPELRVSSGRFCQLRHSTSHHVARGGFDARVVSRRAGHRGTGLACRAGGD